MVVVINSMSFSFIAAIGRCKSSTGISPRSSGAATGCPFQMADYWDRSWSCLPLSVSLRSASHLNLWKTFPKLLLASWLRWVLSTLVFTLLEVNVYELATSISGFTPVCWVFTAIGFLLVRCVCSALGFLPLHRVLRAFGFSPDQCETEAHCSLVTSFLLVLVETKSWGNTMLFDDVGH